MFNVSQRNPWYPVTKNAPLRKLLDIMCRWNVHRVPVLDTDGEFYSIASQSDLLEYIHAHLHTMLSALGESSVEAEKVGTWGNVFSVTTKVHLLCAY